MSLFDKFLDIMRLNGEDDDDDDYDFVNDEYFDDDDDYDTSYRKSSREHKKESFFSKNVGSEKSKPVSKITPITKPVKKQGDTGMQVCVIKPTSVEEEMEIVETLLEGRTVVINMEGLNIEIAQRIIDFTCGATFAIHGNLQKITNYIFLATPNGVDISGDIQNIMDSFGQPGNYTF